VPLIMWDYTTEKVLTLEYVPAAAEEEVVYEVVAEPQEPQGQAPQQEVRGESAQGPTHPSAEQQSEGKPRCTT